jgi:ferrous-iron efflux pump FieF
MAKPAFTPGQAQLVAVAVATFLMVLKAAASWTTGSLALGSAALDSAVDVFISTANYFVLRRSVAPPDEDHAYGHGKFESLAALGQGLFLAGGAAGLVIEGVRRFSSHAAADVPRDGGLGIVVLLVAGIMSLGVARLLKAAAERSGSPALKADSQHYGTDLWINLAALAALLVVRWTGWWQADPLVALAVAALILRTAAGLVIEAVGDLSDRVLPHDELARIETVVAAFAPRVLGMHDLKTRRSGRQRFVELHLEIPKSVSFEESHKLTVEVLRAIERELPRSKVFVHGDPV